MLLKSSSQRNAEAVVRALGDAGFPAIATSRATGSVVWIRNVSSPDDEELALGIARAADPLTDVA